MIYLAGSLFFFGLPCNPIVGLSLTTLGLWLMMVAVCSYYGR